MSEKKTIKSTLLGVGASVGSILGIGCGSGACAAVCAPVCIAPVASILGISTAGFSSWMITLLPLLTAISAVAFTIAFLSIYKKTKTNCNTEPTSCCDTASSETKPKPSLKSRIAKPLFWITLFLTIGFYSFTIYKNNYPQKKDSGSDCGSSCTTMIEINNNSKINNFLTFKT